MIQCARCVLRTEPGQGLGGARIDRPQFRLGRPGRPRLGDKAPRDGAVGRRETIPLMTDAATPSSRRQIANGEPHAIRTAILLSCYQDSVVLMQVAAQIRARPGSGKPQPSWDAVQPRPPWRGRFSTPEDQRARPEDLILAVDAETDAVAAAALATAANSSWRGGARRKQPPPRGPGRWIPPFGRCPAPTLPRSPSRASMLRSKSCAR